jgi:hypothetical protein
VRVLPTATFALLLSAIGLAQTGPVAHAAPPAPATTPALRPTEVYVSHFDSGKAGDQWSNRLIQKSPSGKRTFLGTFGSESTTLSLDNLPDHARVRLSADLLIILSWDGDTNLPSIGPTGPDVLDITVDHGPRLLHASFVCRQLKDSITQSFPGNFPYDHVPFATGAVENGSLGYAWPNDPPGPDDRVFHIERTFAHTGKSLKITFSGLNLQEKSDEAWGLDHVRVSVVSTNEPQPLDPRTFDASWSALSEADPTPAVAAMAALVDLGDAAVKEIRQRSQPPATQSARDETIRQLIVQLDDDSFSVREQATTALRNFGPSIAPILRNALNQPSLLPEARARIDLLLAGFGHITESADDRRARRLVEVLELIGTAEARKSLADLAAHAAGFAPFEAHAAAQRLAGQSPIPTKLELPPGLADPTPQRPAPPTPPFPLEFHID